VSSLVKHDVTKLLLAKVGLFVGTFFLMMVVLEVVLRLTKEPPWEPDLVPFKVEPGGRLYEDDPLIGYRLKPGRFTVYMADGFPVQTTHLPSRERATGETNQPSGRSEIWIFGCSYTYGWSVTDEETFPWLTQQALPSFRVRNFGVPGYGDLQGLQRFREELTQGVNPKMVVLVYAAFHDERNAGLRRWQKSLIRARNGNIGTQGQSKATLDSEGNLKVSEHAEEFWELPGMRTWSIPHSIEKRWNKIEANAVPTEKISQQIIRNLARETKKAGAVFLLAGIGSDLKTESMLRWWEREGGTTADISVNMNENGMRNDPHDCHPGPKAHRVFAARLLQAIQQNK
jgi:hypothetical protein